MTTSCPRSEVFGALIDGELGETHARAVRAHAESCGSCRAMLDELVRLTSDLRAPVPGALGGSPEAFADELVTMLAARAPRKEPLVARARRTIALLAVAACIPIAVGVTWQVTRRAEDADFTARGRTTTSTDQDGPRRTLIRFGRTAGAAFEPLLDDARLRPNDILAGEVWATDGATRYLLAFLVDATGERHWIYPSYGVGMRPPEAMALPRTASPRVLGSMVRLDRPASGAGRLVAVVLPRPESVAYVEGASPDDLTRERLAAHYPDALVTVTDIVVEEP